MGGNRSRTTAEAVPMLADAPLALDEASPGGGGSSRTTWPPTKNKENQPHEMAGAAAEVAMTPSVTAVYGSNVPEQAQSSTSTLHSSLRNASWPTADEEKLGLFQQAQAAAREAQPEAQSAVASTAHSPSTGINVARPTTEEERARLFKQAQATARKTQAQLFGAVGSARSSPGNVVWPTTEKERIRLFEQARAAAQKIQAEFNTSWPTAEEEETGRSQPARSVRGASSYRSPLRGRSIPTPQYHSVADEIAALRRYVEAKLVANHTQSAGQSSGMDGSEQNQSALAHDPHGEMLLGQQSARSYHPTPVSLPASFSQPPPYAGPSRGNLSSTSFDPPPLMPRPPISHLLETCNEDACMSSWVADGVRRYTDDDRTGGNVLPSPISNSSENVSVEMYGPPPLPPKPIVE